MKKFFRCLLLIILIIPMAFMLTGCSTQSGSVSIISIQKTSSSGYTDTYTITYEDGKTYCFTVTNGANGTDGTDGDSYDINDIYSAACDAGYDGTFLEFLQLYLNYSIDQTSTSVNKALLSVVSVYSNFVKTQTYMQMGRIYTKDVSYTSAGSGVIYYLDKDNGDAYIITNYHVIYDVDSNSTNGISDSIYLYLYGYEDTNSKIDVTFYGGSMDYDIAVLEIDNNDILKNSDALECTVADSNNISVGSTAIAIGNPEALGISASSGIVSVDSEYISMTGLDETSTITHRVIRIDTAINGGNSGGGLFDANGNLIGIVNAKIVDDEIENIAFAIPSNIATNVAQNIIDNNGTFKYLDLSYTLASSNTKSVYNTTTQKADIVEDVYVKQVDSTGLANTIGLLQNDVITSVTINGIELSIDRLFKVIDYLLTARANDTIKFEVNRNNETQELLFVVNASNLVG